MKQIVMKVAEGMYDGKPLRISYRDQLTSIMSMPMDAKSADLDEVRRSIRILDVLETATDVLELEDADYEYLKRRVTAARWPIINAVILTFVEDVTR